MLYVVCVSQTEAVSYAEMWLIFREAVTSYFPMIVLLLFQKNNLVPSIAWRVLCFSLGDAAVSGERWARTCQSVEPNLTATVCHRRDNVWHLAVSVCTSSPAISWLTTTSLSESLNTVLQLFQLLTCLPGSVSVKHPWGSNYWPQPQAT